jgi:hypothetical protein
MIYNIVLHHELFVEVSQPNSFSFGSLVIATFDDKTCNYVSVSSSHWKGCNVDEL